MRFFKLFFIAFAIILLSCTEDTKTNSVDYKVSPITIDGKPMLKVNISCKAGNDGETSFLFLNDTWGEVNLHNTIHSMKPLNEASKIEVLKDSGWITIQHPKDLKNIDIEYVIKQDTEGDLTTEMTYRPVIQPKYFHVFSHGLFMIPRGYANTSDQKFDVNITWENFPDDYVIQNSFGSNERQQKIEGTSERYFIESIFLGGDYRTYNLDINDNEVVFSTRGEWKVFKDSTMLDVLNKTIIAQRSFWKDHSQSYFSVNLTPTVQEKGSGFQGTGLTNSFDCSATNNENLQIEGLVYLFNHELLHNWIGHLIKNDNEEEQYWFSEGFTDYYSNKNIAKFSIYNLDESYFISKLNEIIKLLFSSPVSEAPNSEINYDNFWSSRDYEKLPYRRGALFAFYLDYKIQQDSEGEYSLDDLMLELKKDALKSNQKLTHHYFINKANAFLKENIKPFFDMHIENGKLLNLEQIFNDFGFEYTTKTTVFDQGFAFSEDMKWVLSIDKSSQAFKSGLREGDRITGRSIYYNSIDNKAEIIVMRNEKEETISYYPIREANIPQLLENEANEKKLNF